MVGILSHLGNHRKQHVGWHGDVHHFNGRIGQQLLVRAVDTADAVPGKRSAGSLSWGGINNTYFWIDRSRGIAGVILMQFLPFADRKALALYDAFERGVYQLAE